MANEKTWDRFCWFSFDEVGTRRSTSGLTMLNRRDKPVPNQDESVIRELEALLITVLGTQGQNKMRFESAVEWKQIRGYSAEEYLRKVGP